MISLVMSNHSLTNVRPFKKKRKRSPTSLPVPDLKKAASNRVHPTNCQYHPHSPTNCQYQWPPTPQQGCRYQWAPTRLSILNNYVISHCINIQKLNIPGCGSSVIVGHGQWVSFNRTALWTAMCIYGLMC